MRSSFLLTLFLGAILAIFKLTLSSNSTGAFMAGTQCGTVGCHGISNDSVSVAIFGLPDTFVAGQTYNLTLSVIDPVALKAGFNLQVSAGTVLNTSAGAQVNASQNELTHTSAATMTSNQAIFTFQWTAPNSANDVTFLGVGNAVNGDGLANDYDHWDNTQEIIPGKFATEVEDLNLYTLSLYPNPAQNSISLRDFTANDAHILLFNLKGQIVPCQFIPQGTQFVADISALPAGDYFIKAISGEQVYTGRFVKL